MATDRSAVPLQGFVSNKDSEREDGKGDPLETLLYAVLVASSARASVAELATILQVGPRLVHRWQATRHCVGLASACLLGAQMASGTGSLHRTSLSLPSGRGCFWVLGRLLDA